MNTEDAIEGLEDFVFSAGAFSINREDHTDAFFIVNDGGYISLEGSFTIKELEAILALRRKRDEQ